MLGMVEGGRQPGRPAQKWIDDILMCWGQDIEGVTTMKENRDKWKTFVTSSYGPCWPQDYRRTRRTRVLPYVTWWQSLMTSTRSPGWVLWARRPLITTFRHMLPAKSTKAGQLASNSSNIRYSRVSRPHQSWRTWFVKITNVKCFFLLIKSK